MDRELTSEEFNEHTNRIIAVATADGIIANDVICATAKALGVLVSFTARRDDVDLNGLLKFAQKSVADFAHDAHRFIQNQEAPTKSRKWSLARAALWSLLIMTIVFITSNMADGGTNLSAWMRSGRPAEFIGYLFGQIFGIPIIVVISAWIRNRFVS